MKKITKIYLEQEDINKLKMKAEAMGFQGRGSISHYIQMIAKQPIVFLDENAKTILKSLNLKSG